MREILINTRTYATGLTLNDVRCAEPSMESLVPLMENYRGQTERLLQTEVSDITWERLTTCRLSEYVTRVGRLIESIYHAERRLKYQEENWAALLEAA